LKRNRKRKSSQTAEAHAVLVYLFVLHAAIKAQVAASQLAEMLALRGMSVSSPFLSTTLDDFKHRGWLTAHLESDTGLQMFQTTQAGESALWELKPALVALHREMPSGPISARRG